MNLGESSLVIAVHALTLVGYVWCGFAWGPWMWRRARDILRNPMGLLLLACGLLSALIAFAAVYYSIARVAARYDMADMWGGVFTYAITASRGLGPLAFLMILVARWRLTDVPPETISRRVFVTTLGAAGLFGAIVAILW